MIAIDTNILLDIFTADPDFSEASSKTLRACMQHSGICANEVVWSETAAAFSNEKSFKDAMQDLNIEFVGTHQESAVIAAKIWRQYRREGGKGHRMVPDFLIGAHGMLQCEGLITRDRGFYKKYFKSLKVIDPTKNKY